MQTTSMLISSALLVLKKISAESTLRKNTFSGMATKIQII